MVRSFTQRHKNTKLLQVLAKSKVWGTLWGLSETWQAWRLSGEEAACQAVCIFGALSPVTQDCRLVFTYADPIALQILAAHLNAWMHHSRLVHLVWIIVAVLLHICTWKCTFVSCSELWKHAFLLFFDVDGSEIHQQWRGQCAGGSRSCADSVLNCHPPCWKFTLTQMY